MSLPIMPAGKVLWEYTPHNDAKNTQPQIEQALEHCFKQWSRAGLHTFHKAGGLTIPHIRFKWDIRSDRMNIPGNHYNEPLGWTTFSSKTGTLQREVYFNLLHRYTTSVWGLSTWFRVNLITVALHEIGHCLGLNHPNTSSLNSIMSSGASAGSREKYLRQEDLDVLKALHTKPKS